MPKKMNRKELQEYIPAGHGDASGEYANEGGSSKHFSNWQNPNKPKVDEPIDYKGIRDYLKHKISTDKDKFASQRLRELEELDKLSNEELAKYNDEYKQHLIDKEKELAEKEKKWRIDHPETIDEWIKTDNCEKSYKDYVSKTLKMANPENKKMLDDLVHQKGLSIKKGDKSQCSGWSAFIEYNEYDLKSDFRTDGETFFHELGHGLDESYRDGFDDDKTKEFKSLFEGIGAGASGKFITSNGKTLNDTLLHMIPPTRERFKNASHDFLQAENEFYEKNYPELVNHREKSRELYRQLRNEQLKYEQDPRYVEIEKELENNREKLKNKEITWNDYDNLYNESSKEMRTIREKYDVLASQTEIGKKHKEYADLQFKGKSDFNKQVTKHWTDVSDMFSMQKVGDFGFVHSSSYASQKGFRGKEFFAECFSAENCDPESVKLIKKYFPEGWQAYTETKQEIIRLQKKEQK